MAGNTGTFGRFTLNGWQAKAATKVGTWTNTGFAKGASTVMGVGATYIGATQTLTSASQLIASWGQLSSGEKVEGVIMVLGGLAQMGLGGLKYKPGAQRGPAPDLRTMIKNRAGEIYQRTLNPDHDANWIQAEGEIRGGIVQRRADDIGKEPGRNDPNANWTQAEAEFNDKINARAAQIDKKRGGDPAKNRVTAEYEVYQGALLKQSLPAPVPLRQQIHQAVTDARTNSKQWIMDRPSVWKARIQDPGNPYNKANPGSPKNNYSIRLGEYVDQAKFMVKKLFHGYLAVNTLGLAGWVAWNFFLYEDRTSTTSITAQNAEAELKKLQDDPDGYLDDNYHFAFLAIGVGDDMQNFNGHLLAIETEGKPTYYFRRVPEDLYNGLKAAQVAKGNTSDKVFVEEVLKDEHGNPILDAKGNQQKIQVEIRPPYRGEPSRYASFDNNYDPSGPGFRWRPSLSIGPVEGWQMHADLEGTLGHRYTTATATTLRAGAPSPNQGWGIGIRQQDTTIAVRLMGSAGTIDLNKTKVHDLTNPSSIFSGAELMIMNGRVYMDIGNRNRVRFDYSGKGSGRGKDPLTLAPNSTFGPDKLYARARETGFLEIGLGADFLKYAYGSNDYFSVNGYYELQLYPGDLRSQLNLMNGGQATVTRTTQGFQALPQFEIDPALQITTTEGDRLMDLPSWLSPAAG